MNAQDKRNLAKLLQSQGFHISEVGQWPAKATYYKKTGEAMPNLPADPYSLQKYLRRGFTLTPPRVVEAPPAPPEIPVAPSGGDGFKCDQPRCRFSSTSEAGLKIHARKHKREIKAE